MLTNAGIVDEYAEKMVKFAGIVRDGYEEHLISQPIGLVNFFFVVYQDWNDARRLCDRY